MKTFLVSCKACGSPVDTGIVDIHAGSARSARPDPRAWVPALDVPCTCDRCGLRATYSLKRSIVTLPTATPLAAPL